jgi:hypothetical protein
VIPVSTTTVDVWGVRPAIAVDPDGAGYGDAVPVRTKLVAGVRATLARPAGVRQGKAQDDTFSLRTDPCDLTQFDIVQDVSTGDWFAVRTATHTGPAVAGLDHIHCVVERTTGLAQTGADS